MRRLSRWASELDTARAAFTDQDNHGMATFTARDTKQSRPEHVDHDYTFPLDGPQLSAVRSWLS